MRPLAVLAALLCAGCLPHYQGNAELSADHRRWRAERETHPDDPKYPQALFAVCRQLERGCIVESEPALPLTGAIHQRRIERGKGEVGTCCLGGLGFAADVLVVTPLRAVRTVFTLPVGWVQRARWKREADEALKRWRELDPTASS